MAAILACLDKLTARFANWASCKTEGVLFLLAALFTAVIFPWCAAQLLDHSRRSAPTPDARFGYSPDEVYDLWEAYHEDGRWLYAITELTVDLVFPIIYSLMFSLLLALVFSLAFPRAAWVRTLALVPFTVMVADWGENIALAIVFLNSERLTALVRIASVLTIAKWMLVTISLGLLVVGAIRIWDRRCCWPRRGTTRLTSPAGP